MGCGEYGVCAIDQVIGTFPILWCRCCPDLCWEGCWPVTLDGSGTLYCGDGPLQHVFRVSQVQGL